MDPRYGKPFIYIDPMDGGGGALPFDDGADGTIFHGDGDAPNTPVEVAETRYPVRIDRYQFHTEQYGIGQFRGGLGTIRDYRILTDNVYIQIANEQTHCRPHGLKGGQDGGINRLVIRRKNGEQETLTQRVSHYGPFHSGDVLSGRTAGGAGYGNSLDRDPERVRMEVLNGILGTQEARDFYGVCLTARWPRRPECGSCRHRKPPATKAQPGWSYRLRLIPLNRRKPIGSQPVSVRTF